jgi:hypothetical protein
MIVNQQAVDENNYYNRGLSELVKVLFTTFQRALGARISAP